MKKVEGIFLFNKPVGISSAGFLDEIKYKLVEKGIANRKDLKVGHGGTLDPFASGLLVVAFSREYTKKLSEILKGKDKSYYAEIVLGYSSDTYDGTGNVVRNDVDTFPDIEKIFCAIEKIKSKKEQLPPIFSALKVSGVPMYKKARKGEEIELKSRGVDLKNFSVVGVIYKKDCVILKILLDVSSGFYIRSFANDLGSELGIGGYAKELIRYRIGEFTLSEAKSILGFISLLK